MVENKYILKKLMKRNKVESITLAKLLDCSQQTIYNYMNIKIDASQSINSDHLKALAEYFGVSMEGMYTQKTEVNVLQH